MTRKVTLVDVDAIEVGTRHRETRAADVERLAQSLKDIGLQTPLSVKYFPDRKGASGTVDSYVLVAGAHRLAAAQFLGWQKIECFEVEGDDVDAELWEISENLHRADLTVLERSEQVARWIELTEEKLAKEPAKKIASDKLAQDGPVSKGGRGNSGGTRAASRDLGIQRNTASRSKKVAALTDEAKAAAKTLSLDDNGKALLEAAKGKTAAQQVAALQTIAHNKAQVPGPKLKIGADTELFADWLRAHAETDELPMIIAWITNTKPSEVASALRRKLAS